MYHVNKYHNIPTKVGDIEFDSKLEAKRWNELLLLERAGEIRDLKRQVRFELTPTQKGEYRTERRSSYVADFTYYEGKKFVVEDCKGVRTDKYKLKRKLMLYIHNISIKEID